MNLEAIWLGSVASLLAGLATGVEALPVLFTRNVSDKLLDVMLGFSAGVMLAATFFSLLVPAIELGGIWFAVLGIILGAVALHMADRSIPHFHPTLGTEGPSSRLSRVWLFALAIAIHNFPEGLAVGVSFGSGDSNRACGGYGYWASEHA
jgi:ZIP family zinc transporter